MDTCEIERGVCWVSMGRTGIGVRKRGTKSTVPPSSLFVEYTLERCSLWPLLVPCRHCISTLSTREHISLPYRVCCMGSDESSRLHCTFVPYSLLAGGILETLLFAKHAELHTMLAWKKSFHLFKPCLCIYLCLEYPVIIFT